MFFGSTLEIKQAFTISFLDLVITPSDGLPMILSRGCIFWILTEGPLFDAGVLISTTSFSAEGDSDVGAYVVTSCLTGVFVDSSLIMGTSSSSPMNPPSISGLLSTTTFTDSIITLVLELYTL